jgi:hypothetical protein
MVKINIPHKNFTESMINKVNEHTIHQNSELREIFDNLDSDTLQEENLTSIDFNTRLSEKEIGDLSTLQMMDILKVGGNEISLLARTIKRHKVSLNGKGREEKVRIVQGERNRNEEQKDTSVFGKIKGFLSGDNNEK